MLSLIVQIGVALKARRTCASQCCIDTVLAMSYQKTVRSWRRTTPPYPLSTVQSTETLPENLGAHDVVIRIHTVSLNYRDGSHTTRRRLSRPR